MDCYYNLCISLLSFAYLFINFWKKNVTLLLAHTCQTVDMRFCLKYFIPLHDDNLFP